MTARILAGSVFDMLPTITPGSVDAVVTSPPYWCLRSYLPKDHPLKAQELGSEPTVQEFVQNMVRVFGLVRETMADHATLWLNCGETYSGSGRGGGGGSFQDGDVGRKITEENSMRGGAPGIPPGNRCLVPERLTIALQEDGWIIRSVIVWHKPAPMPASVSGWMWKRCRVKVAEREIPKLKWTEPIRNGDKTGQNVHAVDGYGKQAQWSDCPGCEKCEPNGGLVLRRGSWRPTSSWEPILMLAKSSSYYADGEAVKTPYVREWNPETNGGNLSQNGSYRLHEEAEHVRTQEAAKMGSGANPRDVQTWASEPLKLAHYAAYPTALVRFCLRAGTSLRGYCPTCGAPWARVVERVDTGQRQKMADGWDTGPGAHGSIHRNGSQEGEPGQAVMASNTVGWKQTCSCPPAESRPGLVLDPFAGSGRTLLTANRMGLDAVGVELNPIYCEMAERLLREDSPLFSWTEDKQ